MFMCVFLCQQAHQRHERCAAVFMYSVTSRFILQRGRDWPLGTAHTNAHTDTGGIIKNHLQTLHYNIKWLTATAAPGY